jgi:hypothetical protein
VARVAWSNTTPITARPACLEAGTAQATSERTERRGRRGGARRSLEIVALENPLGAPRKGSMKRWMIAAVVLLLAGVEAGARAKLVNIWAAPGVQNLTFANQKVIGLVISDDESLRMSGEEALASELIERGIRGDAAYRVIPREELRDPQKAKGWFERTGATGVVALRLVDVNKEVSQPEVIWTSATYASFWNYYPYGWGNTFTIVPGRNDTKIKIETLVYDLSGDKLIWAATSETTNPKSVRAAVKDIVQATADEMKKRGLTRR